MARKKAKKEVKKKKVTKKEEVPFVSPAIPELKEQINELEAFVKTAEKWNIHRMGQAYRLLEDTKKKLEQET